MTVSIGLLGRFSVSLDGNPVEDRAWRLRKARTLVKVLALEPGRRLHREQAMELLWPDRDAAAAQNNLHQTLHAARRVLGAERLLLEDGMLEIAGDVETDVDAFEAAAGAARGSGDPGAYRTALELFGGELLPEDRYEPWAEGRRAALTDLHSLLCLELAELQDPADALTTLQRALGVDVLHEPAHRALMRAYDRLGRRQDALAQYQRLRAALRRSLEADPAAETRALYRELLTSDEGTGTLAPQRLPSEVTSFVGRERELAAIADELEQTRLLTLAGPGGSGKTRLAIAATERAVDAARDGVVFVELGSIADPELVGDAAATAAGIPVPSKRTAAEAVAERLSRLRVLVVLDTCEHLLEACASLAETLVESCPEVTVLATSRESLRASGERVWHVPGLAPSEATELFLARARDADPAFTATEETVAEIEDLCSRLEGMPLAVEMAAARVSAFAPAQIAARLDQSLDILSGGRRTARSRQQTLRATIGWSHDLLDGEERVLFRRLSVFAGSFSLDAAAVVCAGGAIESREVVTFLLRIVDKSLAVVEDAQLARYRLLDTVRQFAAECLDAAGERDVVEARLRDWALALVADPPPLAMLELDHDNIRAALDSGLRSDPQGALRLTARVWRFWLDRNFFTEGARRVHAALDAAPEATELWVTTLLAAAALEQRSGRRDRFMELGREAAALVRGMRPAVAADVVHLAALLDTAGGRLDDCTRLCDEALALAGGEPVRASILSVSALPAYYVGEFEQARSRLDAAVECLGAVDGRTPPFFEGITIGLTLLPEGPGGRLRPFHEETIFLFHRFDRDRAVAYTLCNLAVLARTQARSDEALALLGDALARFRRLEDAVGEAHALAGHGHWARSFGQPDRALAWLEQAVALRRAHGDRRAVGMTETATGLARAFGGDLAGAETVFARTHDRFRAADDAPGQGGALVTWGLACEHAGDVERAAELLVAGATVWERGLEGPFPGWGLLAAADALFAGGRESEARDTLARAERVLRAAGETRGVALCLAHPAAKAVQRTS
jgi:predicted ATPase/DNA-binding SARP family transcriptional activator